MSRPPKYPEAFYRKHLPVAVNLPNITLSSIAHKLGLSPSGLLAILRRLDIPTPTQVQTEARRKRAAGPTRPNAKTRLWDSRVAHIKAWRDAGYTVMEIAEHYDVPDYIIRRVASTYRARGWATYFTHVDTPLPELRTPFTTRMDELHARRCMLSPTDPAHAEELTLLTQQITALEQEKLAHTVARAAKRGRTPNKP